jgi:hypothetical protein
MGTYLVFFFAQTNPTRRWRRDPDFLAKTRCLQVPLAGELATGYGELIGVPSFLLVC